MRRGLIYLTFLTVAFPALGQGQLRFTLPSFASGGGSGNVTGPGAACSDNQIARWNGASATEIQCSVPTIDDTTGDMTWPGAFSLIAGGTASDITLTPATTGDIVIPDVGANRPSLKFSSVSGAPEIFRSGAALVIKGNDGSWPSVQTGSLAAQDSSGVSTLFDVQIRSGKQIMFSDGVDYGRGISSGPGSTLTVTDGSTGRGGVRLGDAGASLGACSGTNEGVIKYDQDEHEFCGCNGTAWAPLDGSGTCD